MELFQSGRTVVEMGGASGVDETSALVGAGDTGETHELEEVSTTSPVFDIPRYMVLGMRLTMLDTRRPLMLRDVIGEEEYREQVEQINKASLMGTLPGIVSGCYALGVVLNYFLIVAIVGLFCYAVSADVLFVLVPMLALCISALAAGAFTLWASGQTGKIAVAAVATAKKAPNKWEDRGIDWFVNAVPCRLVSGPAEKEVSDCKVRPSKACASHLLHHQCLHQPQPRSLHLSLSFSCAPVC